MSRAIVAELLWMRAAGPREGDEPRSKDQGPAQEPIPPA